MPSMPDRATAYARAVGRGQVVAGPDVRNACWRHLRDLEQGAARGLRWDPAAADRAIRFFETQLRLNGGQFEGQPFILRDWQAFIVGSLFGWMREDGTRRYRLAYIETGKGSGKSPLAAGIGLYLLTADREARAELYAAASKRDQAMVLFRDAVTMVKQSPALMKRLDFSGGAGLEWNIAFHQTGSFFRVISSEDGQSGPRPHGALLDEIHEHRDDGIVEMVQAGTKFRRQPLIVMITNSGADRTGVCWRYHQQAIRVAAGLETFDSFFSFVCSLDENDDPLKDPSCWKKANPNLGITFSEDWLRERVQGAISMPSREGVVRRLHFCQWTDAAEHWCGRDVWEAAEEDFDPDRLTDLPCFLGLDLASKRDLCALTAAWKRPDDSIWAATWFWTPEETLEERARKDNVPYREWADAGHIFAVPGRLVDKRHIALFVQNLCAHHDVRGLAYDQAQMDDFMLACDDIGLDAWIYEGEDAPTGDGLKLMRHSQGFAGYQSTKALWMPRSISQTEERIVKGTIAIRRNPVLTWNSASAVLLSDPQENRKWDKRKATGRIDGMVSLSQAVGLADSELTGESPYETRGLRVA